MSIQILSAKSTRRLGRELGDPTITRAWVNNSFDHLVVAFATWDHVHGAYNRRTGQLDEQRSIAAHFPSCYDEHGNLLLELDPFDDDGRWPTLND